jgi:hypothetical protein
MDLILKAVFNCAYSRIGKFEIFFNMIERKLRGQANTIIENILF